MHVELLRQLCQRLVAPQRRKGVTLTLLWEEYQAEFADRQTYRYT